MNNTSERGALSRRRQSRARQLVVAAFAIGAALGAVMCSGTTGHEGLDEAPTSADGATVTVEGGADVDMDSGAFDVTIDYVVRELPDVVAPPDTGADASYPWPSCPPFIPVDRTGHPVAPGTEVDQIASEYGEDGGVIPAPDGSACATYPWLGSTAVDECLTSQASGFGAGDFSFLPPCNWCADAGVAAQGPGAGLPMYQLCLDLYVCAMRTGCGSAASPAACLCGAASAADCIHDAGGPCVAEELAALQATPADMQTALTNYTQFDTQYPGYCGSSLNFVFQNARTNGCFELVDAGANQ